MRPTTVKQRLMAASGNRSAQQLLRLDRESKAPLSPECQRRLAQRLEEWLVECDAVLVADHGKGACSAEVLARVFAAAVKRELPVLVDPARDADFMVYRDADLLLPNRREAARALGRSIGTAEEAV